MEAASALISMQVELGTVKIEQLAPQGGGAATKIHLAVDANGYSLDFDITGVKSTTVKLHRN